MRRWREEAPWEREICPPHLHTASLWLVSHRGHPASHHPRAGVAGTHTSGDT